ncbi:MAG TPA: 2-oxoacid:acceptor oxidoreductase family protein [Nitrospiria bacterium]
MLQVRIHGRGGQGVVTAAEILSIAAFKDGKWGQAFPSFGSERMGAPVMAFCRIDQKPIRLREPVIEPDVVIVQDPSLLHQVDLFSGLREKGYVLINSTRSLSEMGIGELGSRVPENHICVVHATDIALKHLSRPVPNAVLLGGLAAMIGVVSLSSVQKGILEKFPGVVGEANARAAEEAFSEVKNTFNPVSFSGRR